MVRLNSILWTILLFLTIHSIGLTLHGNELFAQQTSGKEATAKRPNILFILVDDQSPWDLKAYNPNSKLNSPVLDRLARQGMVIDGAYHMGSFSGAVCTPSRHMIMSGRTVWHLPISPKVNERSLCPPNLEQSTIPAVFNRAGYITMRTCKQGNSYEKANEQFAIRKDATKRGGTPQSGSAWHADRVLEFLQTRDSAKQSGDEQKPFLIYFGFSHPHDERDGTPELLAKYGAVNHTDRQRPPRTNPSQPPLPENYLPEHPFHHGHPKLRDEVDVSGVWDRRDENTIRNELGRELACSEYIDQQIGRVLDKLQDMGELENTYVFYTSDHGIAIGRHGLQGKQNLYEHTWRVPLIVQGPGIPASSRRVGNIYLLDTLATLCDLAGVAIPESNEGISFKPVLMGQKETLREVMYGVYNGGTKPGLRCVKKGDWKLVEWDVLDGKVRKTQLFDLSENPLEYLIEHHQDNVVQQIGVKPLPHQVNLADDPRYADRLAEMRALLLSEMKRLDDPWRLWNQPQ